MLKARWFISLSLYVCKLSFIFDSALDKPSGPPLLGSPVRWLVRRIWVVVLGSLNPCVMDNASLFWGDFLWFRSITFCTCCVWWHVLFVVLIHSVCSPTFHLKWGGEIKPIQSCQWRRHAHISRGLQQVCSVSLRWLFLCYFAFILTLAICYFSIYLYFMSKFTFCLQNTSCGQVFL